MNLLAVLSVGYILAFNICNYVSSDGMQGGITVSDQMDLLVEQVKMLAGEIAFSTSTLKRLVEQSVNDPDSSKTQVNVFIINFKICTSFSCGLFSFHSAKAYATADKR